MKKNDFVQMSLFDLTQWRDIKVKEKIKVLELFGGIGACTQAFKKAGINHEIVDYVEIDKYAVASYNAINGTEFKPQDICLWDKDINVDLICHGSPCQNFSIAGDQAGGDEGSGTKSSLMYETIRIVKKIRPKYIIWENVKNLLSSTHFHNFKAYLDVMDELGYDSYYQVLNGVDFGIPQARQRVFTISIRKDLKQYFEFPEKKPLNITMQDLFEDESDINPRFYLSNKMIDYCTGVNQRESKFPRGERFLSNLNRKDQTVANTITTLPGQRPYDNFVKLKDGKITLEDFVIGSSDIKLRKLTPLECWRLQGFSDEAFYKASQVNSDTQLFKQAGNSIVVNVLEAILNNLLTK